MRPDGIVVFERLMLTSFAISLGLGFILALFQISGTTPAVLLIGVMLNVALTLLVSRKRSEWASYVVLGLYALRALTTLSTFGLGTLFSSAILLTLIAMFQLFIEGLACLMLVSPKVRDWLKRRPAY